MFGTTINLENDNTEFFRQLDETGIKWRMGEKPSKYKPYCLRDLYNLCIIYDNENLVLITEVSNAKIVEQEYFINLVKFFISQQREINKILGIKEPLLTQKEKEYLSTVIKPFRDKVKHITYKVWNNHEAYISIQLQKGEEMVFPLFKRDTIYKEIKPYKIYTLKELDL